MRDLDQSSDQVVSPANGGAAESGQSVKVDAHASNELQVRGGIAAGLRLVAQGIWQIADALGGSPVVRSNSRRAAGRTGVRLPPEPNTEPSSEAELAAAARAARRAGILVD